MAVPASPHTLTAAGRGGSSTYTTPPAQLIDLKEVCRRTGLGRTTIKKLITAGRFPPRIKDPDIRATRWSAAAVESWILDRIARASRP
jgi:transposase/prophage regulatory protein